MVEVILPATESELRAQLDTPEELASLHGDAVIVERIADGACELITTETPGLFSAMSYKARRCPTGLGWTQNLVSSDHYTVNDTIIELEEVEGGTRMRYQVRAQVGLPVGQSLINSRIAKSMTEAIDRLRLRLQE